MITREEFMAQAEAFDLSEANVQRDYVFGWIIAGLYRESSLAGDLVLKGGNALRKGYLPDTRFSGDLDFTTEGRVNPDRVLAELNRVCSYGAQVAGIPFDIERNRLATQHLIDGKKQAFKFSLYFKDMLSGTDHITIKVRTDITEFDRLYLPTQMRTLIHPYSDEDVCATEIRCVKLEEALADKLKCLLQRRYAFDLFDLVHGAFVRRDLDIDRGELLRVFLKKTIFGGSPAAAKQLLLDLPFDLFRGYWHKVTAPEASRLSFDDAVGLLREGVDSLFGSEPAGRGYANAFFPSKLRNPILQAGSDRKLLKLVYDGVARIVEPYSLVFKRRRDGVAQEYLYVVDRTGGRASGPGIKSLFHWKIKGLEILDESFDPRFELELSKAGDASMAGSFAAQGRRRRSARGRRR